MGAIYNSILQGAIAGGTAAYLHDRVNHEASEKKTDTWTTVALQVNHLFWLIAETMQAVSLPLGAFGTLVRVTYIMTPLVLLASLNREGITEKEAEYAQQFNQFYHVGVIVASVATLIFGNPIFAITSLSMLTLNAVVSDKAAEIFAQVRKTAALLAVVGYGAQVFAGRSIMAGLAQVSTVVMLFKLFVWEFLPKFPTYNRAPTYIPVMDVPSYRPIIIQTTPPVIDPVYIPPVPSAPPWEGPTSQPEQSSDHPPYTTPPTYPPVVDPGYTSPVPSAPPLEDLIPQSEQSSDPSPLVKESDLWSSAPAYTPPEPVTGSLWGGELSQYEQPSVTSHLVRETGLWS